MIYRTTKLFSSVIAVLGFSLLIPLKGFAYFGAATQQTFHGYVCSQDCSGHKAGYSWAARKQIKNESQCRGNSRSFVEGCKIFVREKTNN